MEKDKPPPTPGELAAVLRKISEDQGSRTDGALRFIDDLFKVNIDGKSMKTQRHRIVIEDWYVSSGISESLICLGATPDNISVLRNSKGPLTIEFDAKAESPKATITPEDILAAIKLWHENNREKSLSGFLIKELFKERKGGEE